MCSKRSLGAHGRLGAACAVLLVGVFLPGCAVLREGNRYVSRAVETVFWPESTGARIAVAPVVGALWLAGAAVDAVVVNPVMYVPRSLGTAWTIVRIPPALPVVEIVVFPLRVVAFPVVFVGADIVYSAVPL